MYIDKENRYSSAQALTGTAASTDFIDHGSDRNIGIGEAMALVITVNVALDRTSSNETYVAQLQTDSDPGFGTATSVGEAISMTTYAAGTRYVAVHPADTSTKRYTRVNYTLGGTTPLGTVTADLVPLKMLQNDGVFPKGYTIS